MKTKISSKILVAHPLKHHVFPLAAGCCEAEVNTTLVVPLAREKGILRVAKHFGGDLQLKSVGFGDVGLPVQSIYAPAMIGLCRLLSGQSAQERFAPFFDRWLARNIAERNFTFRVFVSLQDYLPLSVREAVKQGALIWSDQILNNSVEARIRTATHGPKESGRRLVAQRLGDDARSEETDNNDVLAVARLVTYPSQYTLEGLEGRLRPDSIRMCAPYGHDLDIRSPVHSKRVPGKIRIVVRANSRRKGGHVLLASLPALLPELSRITKGERLELSFVGDFADDLLGALPPICAIAKLNGISVNHGNLPHERLKELLLTADIFLMPSLSESMSLMAIEAMASGALCILTRECGLDSFNDGEHGHLIACEPTSIARALTLAVGSIAGTEQRLARGAEFARQFTWDRYRKRIADIARLAVDM